MYDLIIIGGGAAGLFLAANVKNKKVLLLEKMKVPGKKILISGGGMCNLTNCDRTEEFITRFGDRKKSNFLKPSVSNFSTGDTVDWFPAHGLSLITREDGKVFPSSLKAKSVVDCLIKTACSNGVEIRTGEEVTALEKNASGFTLISSRGVYNCEVLVLSSGGKGFESTGSDGSGYALVRSLGHKIVELTQGLVAVNCEDYPFASLAGNSIKNSYIDFFRESEPKRYHSSCGDLLFTHKGLSGPVILNNSRYIKKNDLLKVSLISTENKEKLRTELIGSLSNEPKKQVSSILKSYGVFAGLSDILMTMTGLEKDIKCANLNKKLRNSLLSLLLEFPLIVSRKGYFSSAMVTAGGIDIDEINRKTMESKKIQNLYFAGEVIDIDGDTGGYNIQSAFSTAFLIASSLK